MMFYSILSRLVLATFAASVPVKAFAFAVFVVPAGTPLAPGQILDLTMISPVVPAPFGQGVPLAWKQTAVPVTAAFAPDPIAPLTNGTTTWNQNAVSTMNEWSAVGANIAYSPTLGVGNPCATDSNIVAAFDSSLCLGILPPLALGIARLVAVVDSASSIRIVDADVAIIPINTASASGALVTDAFDGPVTFPNVDFRRLVLHEFGHALGLAHPDEVFGNNGVTLSAVMHSSSFAAIRLSADDKNGVLALYPAPAPAASGGGGGGGGGGNGGGSSGLVLAILMGAAAALKLLYAAAFRHRRSRVPPA